MEGVEGVGKGGERAQELHVFRDTRATLGTSPWLQLYLRQDPLGHGNKEQPSWLESFMEFLSLCLLHCTRSSRSMEIVDLCYDILVQVGSGDLNRGHTACMSNTGVKNLVSGCKHCCISTEYVLRHLNFYSATRDTLTRASIVKAPSRSEIAWLWNLTKGLDCVHTHQFLIRTMLKDNKIV